MKNVVTLILAFSALFVLTSCKGSKDIQGEWFATNSENRQINVTLTEDTIKFSSENQNDWVNTYKQIGAGFKNEMSYRQIEFDGKNYTFVFPDKKNKENALILIPYDKDNPTKGDIFWVLSKKDYPDYSKYK